MLTFITKMEPKYEILQHLLMDTIYISLFIVKRRIQIFFKFLQMTFRIFHKNCKKLKKKF